MATLVGTAIRVVCCAYLIATPPQGDARRTRDKANLGDAADASKAQAPFTPDPTPIEQEPATPREFEACAGALETMINSMTSHDEDIMSAFRSNDAADDAADEYVEQRAVVSTEVEERVQYIENNKIGLSKSKFSTFLKLLEILRVRAEKWKTVLGYNIELEEIFMTLQINFDSLQQRKNCAALTRAKLQAFVVAVEAEMPRAAQAHDRAYATFNEKWSTIRIKIVELAESLSVGGDIATQAMNFVIKDLPSQVGSWKESLKLRTLISEPELAQRTSKLIAKLDTLISELKTAQ